MTQQEYNEEVNAMHRKRLELECAAQELALSIIQEKFPDVRETDTSWRRVAHDYIVRFRPEEADDLLNGDLFEVDLLTQKFVYIGGNMKRVFAAASFNPAAYSIIQSESGGIAVVWRERCANVIRFDEKTGQQMGKVLCRDLNRDHAGTFCSIGGLKVYR